MDGPDEGYVWNDGVDYPLPKLEGDRWSSPTAINNKGIAVGVSYGEVDHAVSWSNSVPTLLPPLAEGFDAVAFDIDDDGVIVGVAKGSDGRPHAVRWVDGQIEDLGVVADNLYVRHGATAIASDGTIAISTGETKSRLRLPNGSTVTLAPTDAFRVAEVEDVNANHTAIGDSWDFSQGSVGTLWRDGATLRFADLVHPSVPRGEAHLLNEINDAGWIVGNHYVFEPSTCPQ